MLIIYLLLLSILSASAIYQDPTACRTTTNGKDPGLVAVYKHYKVFKTNKYDKKVYLPHFRNCSILCINSSQCQLAQYNNKTKKCHIYNYQASYYADDTKHHKLFLWTFCNLSSGISMKESQRGFWFYSVHSVLRSNPHLDHVFSGIDRCKELCQTNPLCGGFNFHRKAPHHCELVEIWSVNGSNFKNNTHGRAYYWVLETNFTFTIQNENCRKIKTKGEIGKWKIKKKDITTDFNGEIITKFHTRNFTRCYKSCEFYNGCKGSIFQYSTSTCMLLSFHKLQCTNNQSIPKYDIVYVEWAWCNKADIETSALSVSQSYNGEQCYQIINAEYVALIPFKCFYSPPYTSENCFSKSKKESIYCNNFMSFQWTGAKLGSYSIIFNGHQTFLLSNATLSNFQSTTFDSCELYDASIPMKPEMTLFKPKDWSSFDNNDTDSHIDLPSQIIMVGNLSHKNCLCFEWIDCVEILKRYQTKIIKTKEQDMQFHFVISPKGDIFEVRGWHKQTKIFNSTINSKTIYIGFLGNYEINNPTAESINALKILIRFGVLKKYIDLNYYLITDNDFSKNTFANNWRLYDVIRTQARYGGLTREDCLQISLLTVVLNISVILSFTIILSFMSYSLYGRRHNSDCKHLKQSTNRDYLFNLKIYPVTDVAKLDLYYNQDPQYNFRFDNYKINISMCDIFYVTEVHEENPCLQCWKKMALTFFVFRQQSRLMDVTKMKLINKNCTKHTVCLVFETQCVMSKTVILVIHVMSSNIRQHLRSIITSITSGKCTCSKYKINRLDTKYENAFKLYSTHLC